MDPIKPIAVNRPIEVVADRVGNSEPSPCCIVYQVDGRVVVVIPAPGVPLETVFENDIPEGVNPQIVDMENIPSDKTFRNAWVLQNGKIAIDMARARDVWRDGLRRQRQPLLEALDREYMRADEVKNDKAKDVIVARKVQLRDVTADSRIDAATSIEDLISVVIS